MPARWLTITIPIFWLVMTGWLFKRDILPRFGYGNVTYETVLSDRAVAEPAHWNLKVDDRVVGSLLTLVEPQENGGYHLTARGNLSGLLAPGGENPRSSTALQGGLPDFQVRSRFVVSSLGRLQSFSVSLGIQGISKELDVEGTVEGRELELVATGLPILEGTTRVPIDPEAIVLDQFGPINRLPGLTVGKTWTTRAVNPLAAFLAQSSLLGGAGGTLEVIHHTVTGVENIEWNEGSWACYVVQHEHDRTTAKSWVRISDSLVLRQEAPFGGSKVVFEQAPPEND